MTDDAFDQDLINELARDIEFARNVFSIASDAAFRRLEMIDPVLAKAALELFKTRDAAGDYFSTGGGVFLAEPDCYSALANGKREQVLQIIRAAQDGIFDGIFG